MVILRVVHIVTGVIWVGSLFVVVVFVQPSAAALRPAGAPFMSELRRRRFVDVVFIDALFTIGAGSFLYWHDWQTLPELRRLDRLEPRSRVDGGRSPRDLGSSSPGSSRVPPSVGSYPSESRSLNPAEHPRPSWPRGSAGSSAGSWERPWGIRRRPSEWLSAEGDTSSRGAL